MDCGRFSESGVTVIRRCIGGKAERAVDLPSKAAMRLGSNSRIFCPRGLRNGAQAVCLVKRTRFGMTEGPGGPFVIQSSGVTVATLKARFGIGTCPRRSMVATSLVRKGMQMSYGSAVDCILAPNCRIICGGYASSYRVLATGVGSIAT